MFTLTKAMPGDEALCMEIIADGRQFQQEQGFVQWTEAYPALPDIAEDIITNRAKSAMDDYFDYYPELETRLNQAGKDKELHEVRRAADLANIFYVRQKETRGLVHAIWRAKRFVGDEPYAVLRRLAFNARGRGRGLTRVLFDLAAERSRERGITYLRLNTGLQNSRMQHILEKNGFTRRGIIVFKGSQKYAYDKRI